MAVKELNQARIDVSDPHSYLSRSAPAFDFALNSLEKSKSLWSIADQGGRNIFIMPLRVQPGCFV